MLIIDRRWFLKTAGVITAGIVPLHRETEAQEANKQTVTIKDLRATQGVTIEADDGTEGNFEDSMLGRLSRSSVTRLPGQWKIEYTLAATQAYALNSCTNGAEHCYHASYEHLW